MALSNTPVFTCRDSQVVLDLLVLQVPMETRLASNTLPPPLWNVIRPKLICMCFRVNLAHQDLSGVEEPEESLSVHRHGSELGLEFFFFT